MDKTVSRPDQGEQLNPPRHLVITVHGIRTFGQWQERLERLVRSSDSKVKVYNYYYGYFSIIAFLVPVLRWLVTRRFRRALLDETREQRWDRIDVVAHSFGTHLVAWGLYGIPSAKRPKIHTIIFAGSVLKPGFPWRDVMGRGVSRLVNDCGIRDRVLVLNQLFVLFSGMAGRVGFTGMTSERFTNRYFDSGHSGYFIKDSEFYDDFMRDKWVPLLTSDDPHEEFDERKRPNAIEGFLIWALNNAEPIKVTAYLIIFAIPTFVYLRLYLIAEERLAIAMSRQLAFQAGNHLDDRADLALLLSVEASRRHHTDAANESLLVTLRHYPHLASFLHGHTQTVSTVAFSPDGKILASAGRDDGTIRLWDLQTRSAINQPLTARGDGKAMDYVHSVAFSPDGKVLASSGVDGSKSVVRLWDVATGQARGQLLSDKDRGAGWNLAFSPQGNVLASVIGGTIRLWDVETGKPLGQPYTSSNGLASAISQDGKILAVGAADGAIQLWDVATGQTRGQPFRDRSGPYSMAFSPDGKILASGSGSGDGPIQLWDVATGQARGQPFRHRGSVFSVVFSPDGKILASGSGLGTIQLWDVATGRAMGQSLMAYRGGSLAFSPDGRWLALGGADGIIRLWDLAIRHSLAGLPLTGHSDTVYSVAFSPDGKVLASGGGRDGTIRLWDVRTHSAMGPPLTGHTGVDPYVRSVAFSPDGRLLASGGNDGTIRLWDMATRQSLGLPIMTGHSTAVYSVAFSPDGKVLASSGIGGFDRSTGFDNYTIRLWDVATHQPLGLIRRDSLSETIVFSPDGKVLASSLGGGAMGNTTIQLWKVATQQALGRPFTGDGESVTTMIFSPDGRLLVSGGGRLLASGETDGTIRLWNVATQQALGQPFVGGGGSVVRLAFNGEGKVVALVNGRLWNVTNSQPMTTPFLIDSDLAFKAANSSSVAFSPDARLLASGQTDGTIRLWDINISSWEALACRIANRNLTEEEWKQYTGNNERHKDTCLKTK